MTNQPASFVFKLRQNIELEGDLALARIELESFLSDQVGDLPVLDEAVNTFARGATFTEFGSPNAYVRTNGLQGFVGPGRLSRLPELIRCLSFVQHIYCLTDNTDTARSILANIESKLGAVFDAQPLDEKLFIQAVPHYAIFELSDVVARRSKNSADTKRNLWRMLDALMGRSTDGQALKLTKVALETRSTSAHLSHGIHYYKAKFFPRLARSMLNAGAQRLGGDYASLRAFDNFAGSGTALLEASTLGIPSVGLDIDPLSVLISRAKLTAIRLSSELLADEYSNAITKLKRYQTGQISLFNPQQATSNDNKITFPSWLLKNRKMTSEIANSLGEEISQLQSIVENANPLTQDLFRVLMSDAIARKIRMRFLGTGVGRFSLTFAKTPLALIFSRSLEKYVKVAATGEWLREVLYLNTVEARVIEADTRKIPDELGKFDLLVTSPPYLPASSGRESYAKARAPSLIALGMRTAGAIDDLVDGSIGSMDEGEIGFDALTSAERNIVDWLWKDELRSIKAVPTARYFLDMRRAFNEMFHVLRPGALAIVVSGKLSTFYKFSTREALFVVEAAEILAAEAEGAGFEVEALQDVMLNKSNHNARPRSLDDYYETLIMLRRP